MSISTTGLLEIMLPLHVSHEYTVLQALTRKPYFLPTSTVSSLLEVYLTFSQQKAFSGLFHNINTNVPRLL